MKTMKRMAALLLCLSLLIGIPCAVQAVNIDQGKGLTLIAAYAMSNRLALDWLCGTGQKNDQTDHCVVLYFNDNINDAWHIRNNNYVSFYIEPYNAEGSLGLQPAGYKAVDYYSSSAGSNKKVVVLAFGTQNGGTFTASANGFSYWKEQGATDFRLYMVDNKGTGINNKVDGWATSTSYGWTLVANNTYDGKDAVIQEILFESDCLSVVDYVRVTDSKILVEFSEPVAMNNLAVVGGQLGLELHATTGTNLNANKQPSNANGVTSADMQVVNRRWTAQSAKVLGNSKWVEVDFGAGNVDAALEYAKTNNNGLWLEFADNSNSANWGLCGEQVNNGLVDGIWSKATNSPLLAVTGKNRQDSAGDTTYINISSSKPAVWSDNGVYDDLKEALAAGGTVSLAADVAVDDRFTEIPVGVTLDLNGNKLTANNLISFGNVIDSTEGKGGLVISNDKAQALVYLQENNAAFPLYDTDHYRFFTYRVVNGGTKAVDGDANAVKYGVKVLFNSLDAYRLLADEANADASLMINMTIGTQNVPYKFNRSTLLALYNTISEKGIANNASYAISLTIRGLDQLESGTVISAAPALYSARDVFAVGDAVAYTYNAQ